MGMVKITNPDQLTRLRGFGCDVKVKENGQTVILFDKGIKQADRDNVIRFCKLHKEALMMLLQDDKKVENNSPDPLDML